MEKTIVHSQLNEYWMRTVEIDMDGITVYIPYRTKQERKHWGGTGINDVFSLVRRLSPTTKLIVRQ